MAERRRVHQAISLKERLAAFAQDVREKADLMPAGRERDDLLQRASRAETASHLDDWVNSPGLKAPK
jgi:hypothetical protein